MHSLRTKLTLSHALVVLLAVALVGLLSIWLISQGLQQLGRLHAQRDAEQIAVLLRAAIDPATPPADVLRAVAARIDDPNAPSLLHTAPFVLADAQRQIVLDRGGELEGVALPPALRRTASPLRVGGRTVGYIALPVERRTLNLVERSVVNRIYIGVVASSLLAGCVAVVLGLVISRRLTQPLRALADAADQLSTGTQHQPVLVTTNDEVGEVARAFNAMADELAHQQLLRRNLVADIAHELRTPLSVLRLHVEGLADGVTPATPTTFASLGEEVRLLSHLVDDLGVLSLADAG